MILPGSAHIEADDLPIGRVLESRARVELCLIKEGWIPSLERADDIVLGDIALNNNLRVRRLFVDQSYDFAKSMIGPFGCSEVRKVQRRVRRNDSDERDFRMRRSGGQPTLFAATATYSA